ncbi:aftiphilin a isoform X2 [Kryptolebias marmoratus]|uniref:aftiphilin a isoform X2 n=1 Tax=Kryptolebias marmoratus TaxID=37003 RepID=UPI0007F9399D|nr:aftiphilin a isoform X2 [Kryptolebias marmoratus]
MEPDVIRMFSSSPPPMEDGTEEEDDEFGDFGTFSGVPNSISLSEFETPTTFNQSQALSATSPPELLGSRGVVGFSCSTCNPGIELSKANGVGPMSHLDSSERTESRKPVSCSLDSSVSGTAGSEPTECNGGDTEVLTNGFVTFDLQGSPSSQHSVHSHINVSTEDTGGGPEDEFADFFAFSNTEGHLTAQKDTDGLTACHLPPETAVLNQGTEDADRDTDRTGAETLDGCGSTDSLQRDRAFTEERSQTDCTKDRLILMEGSKETVGGGETDLSDAATDGDAAQSDEKSSETETSLGRPLSTEALEEYGDMSTTGSVPSPPLQGDTATPAEDDEDFGDFGDAGSFEGQGFAGFEHLEVQQDQSLPQGSGPAQEVADMEQEDDFGDFSSPRFDSGGDKGDEGGQFPASDSFGNFSSAAGGEEDSGWSAFGEQQEAEGESWAAAINTELSAVPPAERDEEEEEEEWHEGGDPAVSKQTVLLSSRLEKLFHCSFPQSSVQNQQVEERVLSLKVLLEPAEGGAKPGADKEDRLLCNRSACGAVWLQLQDVHEAVGLRYQWGGSHCNKALLCCLGIDTRNILFTGQKKQPVIVPMYAAGLGMLEPTKEPVKPVSAAEMIASIAQTPPAAPEKSSCHSDSVQEALPPVQFDWSSSGLTNPLDASGGSALLNLDFFGPVEDSGSSSSASIPGVDPELFELTTAKLDSGGAGSRVADAFARLMSTVEKTSTSTRKPRKDENLSEEAAKVIAALPDLSFMQAKVLMFPATLTPLSSQATAD